MEEVDLVVTLGREVSLEAPAGTPVRNWDTDEPSERGIEGIERMRLVRDDLDARVRALLAELVRTPTSDRLAAPGPRRAAEPPGLPTYRHRPVID